MNNRTSEEQLVAAVVEQMSFPPYNLEQVGDNGLRLTMAVSGYTMDEIDIAVTDDFITITGKKKNADMEAEQERKFLHHGIFETSFQKRFPLWGKIKIEGASFNNGFLTIDAIRLSPEDLPQRKIEIKAHNKAIN